MTDGSVIQSEIIKLIIPLVFSLMAAYVGKVILPSLMHLIDEHISTSQQLAIKEIYETVAHSAEASRIRAALLGEVFNVLQYAVASADDALARRGIELDTNAIMAGLLAELHKLRLFTDTAPGPVGTPGGEGNNDEGGTRSILPAEAPPKPDTSALKQLMWL